MSPEDESPKVLPEKDNIAGDSQGTRDSHETPVRLRAVNQAPDGLDGAIRQRYGPCGVRRGHPGRRPIVRRHAHQVERSAGDQGATAETSCIAGTRAVRVPPASWTVVAPSFAPSPPSPPFESPVRAASGEACGLPVPSAVACTEAQIVESPRRAAHPAVEKAADTNASQAASQVCMESRADDHQAPPSARIAPYAARPPARPRIGSRWAP